MLQPVKNIHEYKRIKEVLRDRFETERTGEQNLFKEQSKILQPLIKPLISTQEQTVKAIQDSSFLVRDLQRRPAGPVPIGGPTFEADLQHSVLPEQESSEIIKIDLDSGLDETDIKNLQDMNFDLPSVVFTNKQIEATMGKVKTENRRIGQKLGRRSDATAQEKEVNKSYKKTLKIYMEKIQGLEGAKQFVGKGLKKTDVVFYSSVDDLCKRLLQLYAAKQAGNNGLDNIIKSILDELSKVNAISKDEFDSLYKNIFPVI